MPKTAYLTIDDAPSKSFLEKLNFIEERQIPAVWFVQGNNTEERSEMILEAIRRGAVIGNHSYSHPHFSDLSVEQCLREIQTTDALIEELHEQADTPRQHRFFRFPYGDKGDLRFGDNESPHSEVGAKRHKEIQEYLHKLGYSLPRFSDVNYKWFTPYLQDVDWYWTYDSHDWSPFNESPAYGIDTPEKVLARLDEDVPDGWRGLNNDSSADIILVHDFSGEAHELFKQIILRLQEKDIRLHSVV